MKKSTFVIQTSLFIMLGLMTGPIGLVLLSVSGVGYFYRRRNKNLLIARATLYHSLLEEGKSDDEANATAMRLDHYSAKAVIPFLLAKMDAMGIDENAYISAARIGGFRG